VVDCFPSRTCPSADYPAIGRDPVAAWKLGDDDGTPHLPADVCDADTRCPTQKTATSAVAAVYDCSPAHAPLDERELTCHPWSSRKADNTHGSSRPGADRYAVLSRVTGPRRSGYTRSRSPSGPFSQHLPPCRDDEVLTWKGFRAPACAQDRVPKSHARAFRVARVYDDSRPEMSTKTV